MRRAGSEAGRARRAAVALGLALLAGAALPAAAETFPDKPVRIIVPFPPGGGVDVLIRAVAAELSARWGQPVVIDNRAGAGGLIGAQAVAKAAPDGYTLLATINQTITSNRFLYKNLPYDPDKGFAPVSLMVGSDQFLIANPSVPATDLRALVALARTRATPFAYGSFGSGSQPHLLYELLKTQAKIELTHIPYKGVAPAITATLAGEIQLSTGSAGVAGELMRAGKLKPLAVAGKHRSAQFPEVPTTAEQGWPMLLAPTWYALLAPAGTPSAIVEQIATDVHAVLMQPAFAERNAHAKGLEVIAGGPAELAAAIREDVTLTGAMVRTAGVQPE
ncbi:MAG TPA: tripartite tricarboxylate transporter substrate binding protein [Burkholderiaceae bacterium]|jgi:tripartite-type tricarboxylate transporter receptor subunit TctC